MSELEIWNELGNIYYNSGAYDEAIRAYHRPSSSTMGVGSHSAIWLPFTSKRNSLPKPS